MLAVFDPQGTCTIYEPRTMDRHRALPRCALPDNFLSAREAYEFALLRVNEMRQKCALIDANATPVVCFDKTPCFGYPPEV